MTEISFVLIPSDLKTGPLLPYCAWDTRNLAKMVHATCLGHCPRIKLCVCSHYLEDQPIFLSHFMTPFPPIRKFIRDVLHVFFNTIALCNQVNQFRF